MMQDTVDYLPGDILRKVDLAAMSTSLETRIPFLDHEIIAYAWSLPFDYKFRNSSGKYILKDVAHSHIPQTLLDSPKKGFDIPLKSYLRNELKEYSSSMILFRFLRFNSLRHWFLQATYRYASKFDLISIDCTFTLAVI